MSAEKHSAEQDAANIEKYVEQQQELLEDLFEDGFLNVCYRELIDGDIRQGMADLVEGLDERRLTSSGNEWKGFKSLCLLNPICKLVHQDPFTKHGFDQQNQHSYAGDPTLLEFIHGAATGSEPPEGTSEIGAKIFEVTTNASACRGVRKRTQYMARAIDRLAAQVDAPKILSLAVGYLDEAGQSKALRERQLGRWLAWDSEPKNLQEVEQRYGAIGVESEFSTVRQILANEEHQEEFDLIFSTGLFDYLQQGLAKRLTTKLFGMLRPGGQLLIAGFPESLTGLGYMECFMNMDLVCRNNSEMKDLAAGIDPAHIQEVRLLDESDDDVLLLRVGKA